MNNFGFPHLTENAQANFLYTDPVNNEPYVRPGYVEQYQAVRDRSLEAYNGVSTVYFIVSGASTVNTFRVAAAKAGSKLAGAALTGAPAASLQAAPVVVVVAEGAVAATPEGVMAALALYAKRNTPPGQTSGPRVSGDGGPGKMTPQIGEKLNDTNLVREVSMREGVNKAGQVSGSQFKMSEDELAFAARLKNAGAQVFRTNQTENLGDFVVVLRDKVYAVEIGTGSKTAGQLRDLAAKIGAGIPKVAGSADQVIVFILGG
jgi:hypothetical protein